MSATIRWFLDNRVAPNLLMFGLLIAGVFAMFSITVKQFPDIATGTIQVSVVLPGATPQDVLTSVVEPIENAVEGLEGVRRVSATADASLGSVTIDTVSGVDVVGVLRDVETEIERITVFPARAERPQVIEVEPDELAAQIALTGDVSRDTLKTLAERARLELLTDPAVSQVRIAGTAADRIDVEIRRDTLDAYGLGLADIAGLLAAESLDLSGGRIETDAERIQLRSVGEALDAGGYRAKPIVSSRGGATVRLEDIATVRETREDDTALALLGETPAVLLSVFRVGDEQVLDLVDTVTAWLDDSLSPGLPDGVQATLWRDEAQSLRGRIRLLAENAAIGVTLIVAILMLFIDLRVAAWVGLGVVVAFVGTFIPMQVFGVTINQLSLFGFILALGIVVDDAIVVGEAVHTAQSTGDTDPAEAARRAVLRVYKPIVFSSATTIAAFLPLVFLPGSSGQFIKDIALVVIFVLVVSLIESLLILPRHLSHLTDREPRRFSPRRLTEPLRRRVGGAFKRFSDGPLRRIIGFATVRAGFVVCALLGFSIASFSLLSSGVVRFVFFPEIEGNYVTAQLELADGSTAEATLERARAIAETAAATADDLGDGELLLDTLISIGFSAGTQGASSASNAATVEARLSDASSRELTAGRFSQAWREATGEIAGAQTLTFSASRVGVGAPILLQVSSDNDDTTDAAVARIVDGLTSRNGVFDVRDERFTSSREIRIEARPEAAAYGLDQASIARAVRDAFFGALVTEVQRDREEVEVRVRLALDERDAIADLERFRVPTGEGSVPLRSVADLELAPAPATIARVDGRTVTTVTADVDTALTSGGAETTRVMSQLVPELENDYPGLRVSLGGEQEEQQRFGPALAGNFTLALLAIYAILALAFNSYARPLIVLAIIPFGFVGALLGHAALGLNLTLLSLFGVIGLAGVVVNDSLLIVDYIIEAEENGDDPSDAIIDSTIQRFRPVTLTTLTTFFGIAPLILEQSVQAQFLVPTAVALGVGILFASVVMLLLVPALAALYVSARRRAKRLVEDAPDDARDTGAGTGANTGADRGSAGIDGSAARAS